MPFTSVNGRLKITSDFKSVSDAGKIALYIPIIAFIGIL